MSDLKLKCSQQRQNYNYKLKWVTSLKAKAGRTTAKGERWVVQWNWRAKSRSSAADRLGCFDSNQWVLSARDAFRVRPWLQVLTGGLWVPVKDEASEETGSQMTFSPSGHMEHVSLLRQSKLKVLEPNGPSASELHVLNIQKSRAARLICWKLLVLPAENISWSLSWGFRSS